MRLRPYQSYHFSKKDWDYHYTQKGELKKVIKDLTDAKKRHFADGKAIQADANFLSLKILKEYPQITDSIVSRFPVLIIDEVQDTTEIQMAMIDLMDKAGIKKIMIIGDPDQAIFEWNTADSSLFMEKYNSDLWKKLDLDENRRSSTHICNLVNCFYNGNMTSETPDKNFQEVPEVIGYSNDIDVQRITNDFIQKCTDFGLSKEDIAVVYRGISFGEQHFGMIDESKDLDEIPWVNKHFYVRDFVHGKYLIDNGFYKEGLKLIEKGYFKKSNNLNYVPTQRIKEKIQENGFRRYRNEIFSIIEKLPSTLNVHLNQWIINTKLNFNFTVKQNKSNIEIDRFFTDRKVPPYIKQFTQLKECL